ncbi:MAG: galE [Clostridiaceae bacterium]|jgi:UDP-glucose 4-epimerase|nr:galE [Clostridiaceae bacterium]
MNILVTGGVGDIRSHTCVELINEGHEIIMIDNFVNFKPKVIDNIENYKCSRLS